MLFCRLLIFFQIPSECQTVKFDPDQATKKKVDNELNRQPQQKLSAFVVCCCALEDSSRNGVISDKTAPVGTV